MEQKLYPELASGLSSRKTSINSYTELLTFGLKGGVGYVTLYELHHGIWLWVNDFSMHEIPLVMIPDIITF